MNDSSFNGWEFAGLLIPIIVMFFTFWYCNEECKDGNEQQKVPVWLIIVNFVAMLIFGFTLGYSFATI